MPGEVFFVGGRWAAWQRQIKCCRRQPQKMPSPLGKVASCRRHDDGRGRAAERGRRGLALPSTMRCGRVQTSPVSARCALPPSPCSCAVPSQRGGQGFPVASAFRRPGAQTLNDNPAPVVSISDRLGAKGKVLLCRQRCAAVGFPPHPPSRFYAVATPANLWRDGTCLACRLGRRFKRRRLLRSPPETRAPQAGKPL